MYLWMCVCAHMCSILFCLYIIIYTYIHIYIYMYVCVCVCAFCCACVYACRCACFSAKSWLLGRPKQSSCNAGPEGTSQKADMYFIAEPDLSAFVQQNLRLTPVLGPKACLRSPIASSVASLATGPIEVGNAMVPAALPNAGAFGDSSHTQFSKVGDVHVNIHICVYIDI